MEYWEFLLQQEGDHSWLPLDTAQMEILEGRYRIMAHTSQANTPVQVQISQRLLDQPTPKRRSLRRQGQTNGDGLMVVMPFTRLRAGTWDIHCSGTLPATAEATDAANAAADTHEETEAVWAYAIQLQVLPQGSGDDDEWFSDRGATLADEGPTPSRPEGSTAATDRSSALLAHLNLSEIADALDQAQTELASGDTSLDALYRVALNQTALSGHEGEPVGISGQVTGLEPGESCAEMVLAVRLTDPQTAEVVALSPFSLLSLSLPTSFNLAIAIPPNLSTRLLLGEVGLISFAEGVAQGVALQRFTVTVDLALLFDAIANQAETEADLSIEFPGDRMEGATSTIKGSSFSDLEAERWANVDLPQGPPRSVPTLTLPRSGFNLPPKIYYPSPHEASARRPTLPPFGATKLRPRVLEGDASEAAAPEQPVDPEIGHPSLEDSETASPNASVALPEKPAPRADAADRPALSLPPIAAPRSPSRESTSASDSAVSAASNQEGASSPPAQAPLLPSHEAMGFRDLKLQDRFWNRLNDMAVTLQQEALQNRTNQTPEGVASPSINHEGEAIAAETIPFAGEVVIYEDEDETLGSLTASGTGETAKEDEEADIISPPMPLLDLPSGELIAGEPLLLTLRVPFHPNRLYLKVWITDPQTRSLVDEPRQVMHLMPNGHGQLEGSLQLTVPLGCLEAQFEAISIDMITQQESYKATVSRPIAPAGLQTPDLLEDLDL